MKPPSSGEQQLGYCSRFPCEPVVDTFNSSTMMLSLISYSTKKTKKQQTSKSWQNNIETNVETCLRVGVENKISHSTEILTPSRRRLSSTVSRSITQVRPKKWRIKRKSLAGGSSEGEDSGFFSNGGNGDGLFGGGNGGGWSCGGFGGVDWEDSSPSWSDPAYDIAYEVIGWIVLSTCLHFAFKKVLRIVADGYSDQAREKVTPIC
ncbi:hypothetical protein RJ639_034192 [Escallonia herrerae]|uniref:Uncharacterized protein n=1 Tax=Escallonia herrerae TaxID=1293975 RepID=A0AA89B9S4_9ASTE|nr:hypothetical protein RJ639_034192 [Escallonia herrerae]